MLRSHIARTSSRLAAHARAPVASTPRLAPAVARFASTTSFAASDTQLGSERHHLAPKAPTADTAKPFSLSAIDEKSRAWENWTLSAPVYDEVRACGRCTG